MRLCGRLGALRRIVSATPELADFYIPLTTDLNATIGGGTLTGTGTGSPAVASGKLNLKGSNPNKYVTWPGTGNFSATNQIGCLRFKYTPNYSGTPGSLHMIAVICKADGDLTNMIGLYQVSTDGSLQIDFFDGSGGGQGSLIAPSPSFSAGVEVEIELNWNFTVGATRLFVGGTQAGSTFTGTFTRNTSIDVLRLGAGHTGGFTGDAEYRHLRMFNAVQHTSNYTPA